MLFGNFMFCKAIKNDCRKLYSKMDKLSKKDCFKRFERVFARNLSVKQDYEDTKLKRYKNSRLQNFKDTKIQGFYFNLFCCFTGLVWFFAVLFVSHRTSSLVCISTQRGIMKRIRTITETLQMLKQEDPNTGLSEFLIRKLANNYKIRSFKTGNKILIDYDSLMAFLQSKEYDLPMEQIVVR